MVNLGEDTVACPFTPFSVGVSPEAGNQYLWSDGTVLPVHPITTSGNYILTVTNAQGCSSSDTIKVEVCPLGVEETNSDVVVYPNPANDYFQIYSKLTGKALISVYNAAGALVFLKVLNFDKGSAEIATGNMAAGIYTMRLISDGKSVVKKLVIAK